MTDINPRPTRRQTFALLAGMAGVLAVDRFGIKPRSGNNSIPFEAYAYATPPIDPGAAIHASLLLDFTAEKATWEIMDVSVGPAGDPIVLQWERPVALTPDPEEAEWPGITMRRRLHEGPNRYRVLHLTEFGTNSVDIDGSDHAYYRVQPLAGEGYLLVEPWPRDDRPNGDVYSPDGSTIRSLHLGGGISHLQATSDNRIWVGYIDEGVIEDEIGRYGVNCFDSNGSFLFRYNSLLKNPMTDILDCYAMNTTDDETWLFTYVDFPLSRIRNNKIDGYWPGLIETAPIAGSSALAVHGDRLLFASPYDAPDNLYLLTLDQPGWQGFYPVDETGAPVRSFRALGRGSRLYLHTEQGLRVIDLTTI